MTGHEEAAIFETWIVPRYLSFFGDRLVAMIAEGSDARICHLHCRTGYPDRTLLARLPNVHVHGSDRSENAIELARTKAAALAKGKGGIKFDYRVVDALPLPFPEGAFSHAFSIHPLVTEAERRELLDELARLVASRGQALLALPLRGSFVEIADLLREFALKHERRELLDALDAIATARPTAETLKTEVEERGFEYVTVDAHTRRLSFPSGRAFFEDPLTRLLLLPELRLGLPLESDPVVPIEPLDYVRMAIDKYWSGGAFELTINVGIVSGRRRR